jgi:hypothetical protein
VISIVFEAVPESFSVTVSAALVLRDKKRLKAKI